jgi:hypothetical protein
MATTGDQRRDGGNDCQYARESHQAMLSWDAQPAATGHDLVFCVFCVFC